MASWRSWTRADGTRGLLYRNRITKQDFLCGVLSASTSNDLMVDWIITNEAAKPLDVITFDTGLTLVLMRPGAMA